LVCIEFLVASEPSQFLVALYKAFFDHQKLNLHCKQLQKSTCQTPSRTKSLAWQKATDYGQRSLVETTMGRYKSIIGTQLRARGFESQKVEAAIGVAVLNRMLGAGRPNSVRIEKMAA
jgi:hypothetical protein